MVDTPLYLPLPLPTVYEHQYVFECTHRTVIKECEEIFAEIDKKCTELQMNGVRLRLTLVFATAF